MSQRTAYITTPIYYVNDRPHIGHVYTTSVCDVWARFMRFAGRDVFFLTGTDEHAAKVVDAAAERDLSPQEWADRNAREFQDVFQRLKLTNDDFIRTSQPRHVERVERYVRELLESGDVYLGEYEGWYDAGQEEYVPENRAKESDYKSPINGRPLIRKKEENYFFRLSRYSDELLALLESGSEFSVQPSSRRNEVVSRIRDGLNDVPISRTGAGGWGIQVPGNEAHTIYVWIDALFNYLSTVDTDERRQYWPATVHVIAKDILWFHAVIWPAMLLALQRRPGYEWVKLPGLLYVHSFWISEGQKMSKSMGNFIDLEAITGYVDQYGLDAWRYYLLTQGPLGATDANFTAQHFHDVYHTDLVNTVGNCASRVTAMIGKYFGGMVPAEGADQPTHEHDWPAITGDAAAAFESAMHRFAPGEAIQIALSLVRRVDSYINQTEPFKLARDDSRREELAAILYRCVEAVRIASLLLSCVLPEKTSDLWNALGLSIDPRAGRLHDLVGWGGVKPGQSVSKVALFPRVERQDEAVASSS